MTEELRILTFVNGVSGKVNTKELPAEFQGIGKLYKEHRIQLQTGAKELLAADPFSRASLRDTGDTELEESMEAFLCSLTTSSPVKDCCLQWLKTSQQADPVCTQLRLLCKRERPSRRG